MSEADPIDSPPKTEDLSLKERFVVATVQRPIVGLIVVLLFLLAFTFLIAFVLYVAYWIV